MKTTDTYETQGGIQVVRSVEALTLETPLQDVLDGLNRRRGALFASGYEYPGRYSRWDIGFVNPPVELKARQRAFEFRALNERGRVLLDIFRAGLEATS